MNTEDGISYRCAFMQFPSNSDIFFPCQLYILGLKANQEKRKPVIGEVIKELAGVQKKKKRWRCSSGILHQ